MKNICIICGILLLIAIPNWLPYGFYIFLRCVISISSIFLAVEFNKKQNNGWLYTFGLIAILFNPIIPIYLDKSIWVLIDLVVVVLFFISIKSIKKINGKN